MRAYFDKLLNPAQQQKQLALIITGGWRFSLLPYCMLASVVVVRNRPLALAGIMGLDYGLWVHSGSIPLFMYMAIPVLS